MIVFIVLLSVFAVMALAALIRKPSSVYSGEPEEKNPLAGKRVRFVADEREPENADGARGRLEAVGESRHRAGVYERVIKRFLDVALSFAGLVALSPVFLLLSLWIVIDDPGPVIFTQKRVGKDKVYFKLHKFRSMKMSTPHEKSKRMLAHSEQYMTRAGRFLRAHSLDELPQLWDIFMGNMSIVGPRPGLWNQDLLTAERDLYGANDVKPGLTGWAQINGRDELDIPAKAKLDGEYCRAISLKMDSRCFFGSIGVFAGDRSIVEGRSAEGFCGDFLRPRDGKTGPEDGHTADKRATKNQD